MSENKHTPEPWKLSGTENIVAGGNYVVALDCRPEDARRIVACVNACAEITDEALEVWAKYQGLPALDEMLGYIREIKKQRDELLATLERCRGMVGHPDNIAIIDDAIASVKESK